MGRKMFFDARDTRLSAPQTNVACSSCHIDARDDGHVWNFPDGPRQTPSLAGRSTLTTGPWHWSGEFTSLDDFYNHTIRERMGGSGLSAIATNQMKLWLDTVPGPDNAQKLPQLTEQQAHGAQVFGKAGCGTCHSSENLTNGLNADVGSTVRTGTNPDTGVVLTKGFNVPSLKSVARTAPFMHDGSMKTLEERVFNNPSDSHGSTSSLSEDEKAALVSYLKTL
jgi:cytochrome c peroxidase